MTHTTLLRQVPGDYAVGDKYNTRYVVAQIRKKLGDDPANPGYIVDEPGAQTRGVPLKVSCLPRWRR
ncbi:MAG: hypothetical protein ABI334_07150 [Candidatus Dormiibacterota bacterium]